MEGLTVGVVIPVYNQVEYTQQCLDALLQFSTPDHIAVVDNGSDDGTAESLAAYADKLPGKIEIVSLEENFGFPVACNRGAAVLDDDVILFLNNDVIITGDVINPIRFGVAVYGRRCLIGESVIYHDTGWNNFGGEIVPYVPGWFMAIPSLFLFEIGGLDERYSPYDYEDVDLSRAVVNAGGAVVSVGSKLPITHLGGMTGRLMPDRRDVTETNRIKFADKWGLKL